MRVLVCGGRDFYDWDLLSTELEKIHFNNLSLNKDAEFHVIQGGAIGADFLAKAWAEFMGFTHQTFKADWDKHKYAAGPIRNQQMIDEGKPDLVVAFPGGNGTKDMIRKAIKNNIEVVEINE